MRFPAVLIATSALVAAGSTPQAQPPESQLQLSWPLACEPGRDCFIQNYFDRDPGPGWKDYRCGSMSYDGHDAVDIRLPDLAAMRRGVTVVAAAGGRVRATRDGEPDISINDPAKPKVAGRDCGNAVIVDHSDGWETTYCHMKQGSIRVAPGDEIRTGQPIGQVGLSGKTEFPHLHLGVRKDRVKVDPFAYGAPAGACAGGANLWAASLRGKLAYRSPSLIKAGFAGAPVTREALDAGEPAPVGAQSMLVAYAVAIGLETGDVQALNIAGPDGKSIAANVSPPLDRPKAQWMTFVGDRSPPPGGWSKGTYRAGYAVRRNGRLVLQQGWTMTLR